MPPIGEQIAALERYLGRQIPSRLREVYIDHTPGKFGLLPLATGREDESPEFGATVVERFHSAQMRLASVLGETRGSTQAAAAIPAEYVWPTGLLVVEDYGCGIYFAVDLDDAALRVVRYEHFDPVDDPEDAASGSRLAYQEPTVPRNLQHRFTVAADSLDDWLATKRAG